MTSARISVNRAPVLTLWTAVVAERLGYERDEAVALGRTVAGLTAASKARTLGLTHPKVEPSKRKAHRVAGRVVEIEMLGRTFPAIKTKVGLRPISKGKPVDAASVHRYLESKFGDDLPAVREAMKVLAKSRAPRKLAAEAFELYEAFRPVVPRGTRGWGSKGVLDLGAIRKLAKI